jgi:shikimate kinase
MGTSNIVLIGFMGSGKSTVGKVLAPRLSKKFVDLDHMIVERAGRSIPEIFATDGEAAFRQLESQVLADVLANANQVISTGGGAVLAEANRQLMRENGLVVWLRTDVDVLIQRMQYDTTRPLLQGDAKANITRILEERRDAYNFATLEIDTGRLTVEEAVQAIANYYKQAE